MLKSMAANTAMILEDLLNCTGSGTVVVFAYLAAVKENNGEAMSLKNTAF